MEAIFDFVDLGEGDHDMATLKYSGSEIKCKTCIVGVTPSACSFLAAITENLNPLGFFIITVHDILNPIDYANGSEPQTKFVRSFRNEVFRINDTVLILFERPNLCTLQSVNSVFEMTGAERMLVLNSTTESEFIGEVSAPKMFILSNQEIATYEKLPFPNQISHVAAGLLTVGSTENIAVTVTHLVEPSGGPSVESMMLWSRYLAGIIEIDEEATAQHARHIAKIRAANLNGVYS